MFRKNLPRIYELRDQIENPESPNSCFQHLEQTLQLPEALLAWSTLENELKGLDSAAWEFLKKEACVYLTKWDEDRGRGRQQLLTIINQARAYNFLRKSGWSDINFVQRSNKKGVKTHDIQGASDLNKVLCEVKTINISDDEKLLRSSKTIRTIQSLSKLTPNFFCKLRSVLEQAKIQLGTYDKNDEARHMAYIIPHFDDSWGEHNEEYFHQIDQYLCEKPVHKIEIVFHNHRTTFHKAITMQCATVFNE